MSRDLTYFKASWVIKKKRLLEKLYGNKSADYTKFIILSSGRCGSTLLHTYLNSHANILSKGEILQQLYDGDKPNAPKDITPVIFPSHGGNIKAVGIKLFYDYRELPSFKNAFNTLVDDGSIKVIHLVRQNKLAQFVSYKRAWSNLEWSQNRKSSIKDIKLKVDIQEYTDFVKNNEQQKEEALVRFKEHEIIDLTYEELSDKTEASLRKIQTFLGVQNKRLFTALKKQNDKPLSEVVENWEEVKGNS
ncbi:MAG: Stf0 family sulfotransferase [Bacteroidota bacterium]